MVAEKIKRSVLHTAEIHAISPAGCVQLAALIYEKTGKRLSVTTLKRVYGFAYRKFNISPYTLSVLAEYAGNYQIKREKQRKKIVIQFFSMVIPADNRRSA